jgi:hypothetical protein
MALMLIAFAGAVPRLWPRIEPAHSLPLLPPWPWQQPHVPPEPVPVHNLTPGWRATSLGNPAASRYPACWQSLPRTPWDLALFDGRLYVGLGNSSNRGPSANAGPVPLFAYDLKQRRWKQEGTLPEEQISRFLVDGKQLWIAGEDSRGSWRWGNLYRRTGRDRLWWQQRRLPQFIHAHDLAVHQGKLVVAGNVPDAVSTGLKAERHGSALALSADAGHTWNVQRLVGWRATALLPFPNTLFAIEALPGPKQKHWLQQGQRWKDWVAVHQWQAEKGWKPRPEITQEVLLPGVDGAAARAGWIDSATPNRQGVAWIASLGPWGAEQPQRRAFVGLIDSRDDLQIQPIPLEPNEQAMDWQADGDGWLLLSSRPLLQGGWRSRIQRYTLTATKPHTEDVVVEFEAPLPAWSLAGTAKQRHVALGAPPFQNELPVGSCSPEAPFSGTVLMLGPA